MCVYIEGVAETKTVSPVGETPLSREKVLNSAAGTSDKVLSSTHKYIEDVEDELDEWLRPCFLNCLRPIVNSSTQSDTDTCSRPCGWDHLDL